MRLGKTQVEFENGYYVVDLFDVLEAQNRTEAQGWLTSLQIESSPYMEKEDRTKFIGALQKQAGVIPKKNEFDEKGFELLKMKLTGKL